MGGGTPSVLPPDCMENIVTHLNRQVYGTDYHAYEEFTVEVNPEDIVEGGTEYVRFLSHLGVNRISMGVQSFDDSLLKWMNRRHDAERAVRAFGIIGDGGISNISIDLIYGIGGMGRGAWESTLRRALQLRPAHISAYQLSVEDGSALASMADSGRYVEAGEEDCRRQYDLLCGLLAEAGYHHYEVSNFALPGFEAIHNSAYWKRIPYAGLGPGAHSAVAGSAGKVNVRKWNTQSESSYVSESEVLAEEDVRVEEIMLALRTSEGIEPEKIAGEQAGILLAEGALVWTEAGKMRIPEDRFFVSDEIIRELI